MERWRKGREEDAEMAKGCLGIPVRWTCAQHDGFRISCWILRCAQNDTMGIEGETGGILAALLVNGRSKFICDRQAIWVANKFAPTGRMKVHPTESSHGPALVSRLRMDKIGGVRVGLTHDAVISQTAPRPGFRKDLEDFP